jgi:hypothetical protein
MRLVVTLAFFLACQTSAFPQSAMASYRKALEICGAEAVWKYDDGITPANVVGKTLFGICRRQNFQLYSTVINGQSSAYARGLNEVGVELFTSFVLYHRANKVRPQQR